MTSVRLGIFSLLFCCSCAGTNAEPATPAAVPLRSLRLYETGVGYFERTGLVNGEQALPVPTSHLDDALKSLVLIGEGAKVQALTFPSSLSQPMARALVGVQNEENLALPVLLATLKGARVELALKGASEPLRGRLVELSEETRESPAKSQGNEGKEGKEGKEGDAKAITMRDHALVLLTEEGALRKVLLSELRSVRPTDAAFVGRLAAGLDATSSRGAQIVRALRLLGEGGPVTFGYIAETPLWRSSYRILLDGERSVFQGWALLHNDTDEDWKNIKLSLVNGRPDSFLFPLAAPRYQRRELIHPDRPLPTTPQLLSKKPDDLWTEGELDSFGAGGLGLSGIGEGGGGRGEGIGLGSVGTIGHGAGTGTGASDLLSVGNLASVAQAVGSEQGALFTYTVERPLSLPHHSSALVPFMEQKMAIEAITWLDDGARSALRFENTTGQTLPAGTVAIFRDGGFAGETTLDRLKPGERRFLTFGADLDVELKKHETKRAEEVVRVVAQNDRLVEHFLRTTEHTIVLQNRSPQPRVVHLVLHLNENAKVTGADRIDYDTERSLPVAVFRVESKQSLEKPFTSTEGLARSNNVEQLSPEQIQKLADTPKLAQNERTALQTLATRRTEQLDAQKSLDAATTEEGETLQELERLRHNLEALGGDRTMRPEQNPFVKRILAAEDRLAELKKKSDTLRKQSKGKKEAVHAALRALDAKK